ncbi:NIF3-like protein [Actinobaculum suis]|uniref:GTP cyclohydrolase 1 type 2 homolog n=1 Tax=Actinobaculum suis TaxID=1657 RepID=A0A0K9ERS4_9ACTO|nr:Nif3-like dinuclear metal center hexameric protein [Actinobaculum suis]KMY22893.1 hypothetical protein ACU19_07785 [Actinobaculum suis]OCA93943.1 Nif3-like dinuclear metal center hexameric protein [Actinobaculum suis]OCA94408.1 Nif3-like dinuclear metal center hexameric protein [Actinobaculum suis]VDG76672.1 NIF3-like protein [Actinobaculum suis]
MRYTVADVCRAMNEAFPPETAADWDRVGLIAGAPEDTVQKVHFAVDPCAASVEEAIAAGADMLITHHPLYLRGTSSVAATNAKGRWVTRAVRSRLALFAAHTNADVAASTRALAELVGMEIREPLDPETGIGGVGDLPAPVPFGHLVKTFAAKLPDVPAGVLGAGDPEKPIKTLAICSGSGDSLLAAAQASGADAYFTADLRHHPATDHLWNDGCALICATHWASEWPLLAYMREALAEKLPELQTYVSTIPTDAWNIAVRKSTIG